MKNWVLTDIDECKLDFHDCHPAAVCINNDKRFECQCKEGHRGVGNVGVVSNGRDCCGKCLSSVQSPSSSRS